VQTVTQNLLVALQDAAAPAAPAHTFVGSFFARNKKDGGHDAL